MPRKPTGRPNGRPYAVVPAPTKAAERARQWRLKNLERSRASSLARSRKRTIAELRQEIAELKKS